MYWSQITDLSKLGSFPFCGGYDCAHLPPLRRFPVNAVLFHECLNGGLDEIFGRSAHLTRQDWVARSCEIFMVLVHLGRAKSPASTCNGLFSGCLECDRTNTT